MRNGSKRCAMAMLGLVVLQLLRCSYKKLVFQLVEHNLLTDVVASAGFMGIVSLLLLLAARKQEGNLSLWPRHFSKGDWLGTGLAGLLLVSTPFITGARSTYDILFLLYGAVITPLFEELIFRGYLWKWFAQSGEKQAYFMTTVLFGLWHIGYVDTVIWRTSLLYSDVNLTQIMFWKVITGLVIGIILGAVRYKGKNVYRSFLLHCMINTFGS